MSKLVLCRVCLTHNIRMCSLDNTRYQEIYEKQTGAKLIIEDGSPDMVCYICNSQLQRFYKFIQMFEKTERYLNKMHCDGVELTQENVSGMAGTLHNLSVNIAHIMSCTGLADTPSVVEETSDNDDGAHCTDKTIQDVAVKIESVDYEEIDLNESDIDIDDMDDIKTFLIPDIEYINTDSNDTTAENEPVNNQNTMGYFNNENNEFKLPKVSVALERMPITRSQLRKTDPSSKSFLSCKKCARRFLSIENLNSHLRIHRPRARNDCQDCGKIFKKPAFLQRHIRRIHSTRQPHICPHCSRRFKHRSMFLVHIRTHTGEKPFNCKFCGKTFNDKSNCRKHVKTHTDSPIRHACYMCDLTFTQRYRLKQHAIDHIL